MTADDLRMHSYLTTWQNMHGGAAPEYDWWRAGSDQQPYRDEYRATLPILDVTGYTHAAPPERICRVVTSFITLLGKQNLAPYLERAASYAAAQPEQGNGNGYVMSREDIYHFEWDKQMLPRAGVVNFEYQWLSKNLDVPEFRMVTGVARWLGSDKGQDFLLRAQADLRDVYNRQRRTRLRGVAKLQDELKL